MKTFLSVHQDDILGQITMFDRMIFRGHLLSFFPKDAFLRFLLSQKILLKNFGWYVQTMTRILKGHIQRIAAEAGREVIYLNSAMTAAQGKSKEELAREIARRDGISKGLICVLSTVENCMSFEVRGNRKAQKLEVVRAARKCLHYYFYLIDGEFGFMHIRLQSWFPFQIQLYINGREWMARQMDAKGIDYQRYDNSFLEVQRVAEVQRMCQRFLRRKWARVLDAFARKVNPFLPLLRKAGFGSYWWVLDQAEIATDIMFRKRSTLTSLLPEILKYAVTMFSSDDRHEEAPRGLSGERQLHQGAQVECATDRDDHHPASRVQGTAGDPPTAAKANPPVAANG